ncbi:MAG: carboxypeptidase-like regulatory domain-containing protein [Acidobacteriota bacterium]
MSWLGVRILLLWITMSAVGWAQAAQVAVLSGTISNANGPVARVIVRVRTASAAKAGSGKSAPEKSFEASSNAQGKYSLKLPTGTYDLFATMVGHGAFTKRDIALKSGEQQIVDFVLTISGNEGKPGELTFLHLGDERVAPTGPTPMAGRVPDLTGLWYASADLEPEVIPFQPWSAEFAKTHTAGSDPRVRCLPSGVARANQNELSKFVQTPGLIMILYEGSPPGVRQVFMDGRKHPAKDTFEPSWMGHSIGHWEGQGSRQTLVVDTTGFNDKGWVDYRMTPQTEQLHVIERYTRPDLGHLDLEVTVDDPGAYTRPWKIRRRMALAPKTEEIQEYICNEGSNGAAHMPK